MARTNVTIAAIGQQGHGCTTLAAAIATALAKRTRDWTPPAGVMLGEVTTETRGSATARLQRFWYATDTREYAHADFPVFQDAATAIESGIVTLHGAIVVVSALEGPTQQTRDLVATLRKAGVPQVVGFLSQADRSNDTERVELIDMQTREMLSELGYPGSDLPVVTGSALKALDGDASWESSILSLAGHLDTYIPTP